MDIVGVRVEEAYVALEISLTEIKNLKKALDNCTLNYDSSKEDESLYYVAFMSFYGMIDDFLKEAEKDDQL